ncbi:MAG TPA: glutaminyl-peptide cyclotransferase [Terracidiphilus sp.]|nr:glutaminyl-peptide cyclotransferase [Terracidiphilus sp.]
MRLSVLFCAALTLAVGCKPASSFTSTDTYRIVQTYPHDPASFTQGLLFADGHLYESTGLKGESTLRMDDLATGRPLQELNVPSQYFAEGLAAWGSTLIQLTWKSHVAFVYDRFSFRLLRAVPYPWDGWGLTTDGKLLVSSDGSAKLRFLDPETLREVREVTVKDGGSAVTQLNELEYVKGEIYANVWHTDLIARISPATGKVLGWIDLSGLLKPGEVSDHEAVLNGIAYDARHDRLFVTGKLWPKLFEIQVVPRHP